MEKEKNSPKNIPKTRKSCQLWHCLVHCNFVSSEHWPESKVFYTFVPSKIFERLLEITPPSAIF